MTPEDLATHLKHIENKTLRETLSSGVGFLHGGLNDKEKAVVEHLFKISMSLNLFHEIAF